MIPSEKEKSLLLLREQVRCEVSDKRYAHILRVEECAMKIAEKLSGILSEEDLYLMRAAAILHDVTKDKGDDWQRRFIDDNGIKIPHGDEESPQLWHSFTAPLYVSLIYPDFSHGSVLAAVYKHSTGDKEMSVTDKIICLADYIEDGRKYSSCIKVRNEFFDTDLENASENEKIKHLDRCLLHSFEYIGEHLILNGEKISNKTKTAIEALITEINSTEEA